eukprot:364795-Chlamydomonas_euryale.AAC.14
MVVAARSLSPSSRASASPAELESSALLLHPAFPSSFSCPPSRVPIACGEKRAPGLLCFPRELGKGRFYARRVPPLFTASAATPRRPPTRVGSHTSSSVPKHSTSEPHQERVAPVWHVRPTTVTPAAFPAAPPHRSRLGHGCGARSATAANRHRSDFAHAQSRRPRNRRACRTPPTGRDKARGKHSRRRERCRTCHSGTVAAQRCAHAAARSRRDGLRRIGADGRLARGGGGRQSREGGGAAGHAPPVRVLCRKKRRRRSRDAARPHFLAQPARVAPARALPLYPLIAGAQSLGSGGRNWDHPGNGCPSHQEARRMCMGTVIEVGWLAQGKTAGSPRLPRTWHVRREDMEMRMKDDEYEPRDEEHLQALQRQLDRMGHLDENKISDRMDGAVIGRATK